MSLDFCLKDKNDKEKDASLDDRASAKTKTKKKKNIKLSPCDTLRLLQQRQKDTDKKTKIQRDRVTWWYTQVLVSLLQLTPSGKDLLSRSLPFWYRWCLCWWCWWNCQYWLSRQFSLEWGSTCSSGLGAAAGAAGEPASSLNTLDDTGSASSDDPVVMVGMAGIVELWSSRPKPAAGAGAERSPRPRLAGLLLETFSITGLSPPPPFKHWSSR